MGVIVINITRNKSKRGPLPGFLKTIIDSWYGSLLGLKYASNALQQKQAHVEEMKDTTHFEDNITNDDHHILNASATSKPSAQNEYYWSLLGTCIDRSAFILYVIIYILLILVHHL